MILDTGDRILSTSGMSQQEVMGGSRIPSMSETRRQMAATEDPLAGEPPLKLPLDKGHVLVAEREDMVAATTMGVRYCHRRAQPSGAGFDADCGCQVASNVEMSSLQKSGSLDRSDPNGILNECREIDRGIDQIRDSLEALRKLHDRSLIEADATSTRREMDTLSSRTMTTFRELTDRVRMVKSVPEGRQPRNTAQVGRVERRLKEANQEFQQVEAAFRKKTQDQMARQYRIVRPNASEAEVRNAVEDTSGNAQVFQQALMQGNRMGEATSTLNAVRARQQDMQKIEQTLGELVQLFTDLSVLIEQQETQFVDISQKTEMVEEDVRQANVEIGTAVHTARSTRKKKWICLGVGGMVILSRPGICRAN